MRIEKTSAVRHKEQAGLVSFSGEGEVTVDHVTKILRISGNIRIKVGIAESRVYVSPGCQLTVESAQEVFLAEGASLKANFIHKGLYLVNTDVSVLNISGKVVGYGLSIPE